MMRVANSQSEQGKLHWKGAFWKKQGNKQENEATSISKEKSLQAEETSLQALRQGTCGEPGNSQEASVHRAECEKR